MMSAKSIGLLTEDPNAPFDYILGCRMRRQKVIKEQVLSRAGRYENVSDNLDVKEVEASGCRFVICKNPEQAKKDALTRQAILAKLEQTLSAKGQKAVVGNKGFARFLKIGKGSIRINPEAVKADQRFDGKYVLQTNTELPTAQVAESYKSLWRVERTFREEKSTLEVRPIFHHKDDTSIGHIVASFLALRLEVDLQRRLDNKGIETSWPDLMRDLNQLQAVRMNLDGKSYLIRTDFEGVAYQAFKAARLQPPKRVLSL